MEKILLLTIEYPPQIGGVGRYYKNIVDNWPIKNQIIVFKPKFFKFLWPKWLYSILQIIYTIKLKNIKLLLIGQILPIGYIAYFIKKILKKPYVVFCHGMDIGILRGRKLFLAKLILNKADLIVANSYYTLNLLNNLTKNKSKIVTYPSPNFDLIKYNLQKTSKTKTSNKLILLSVSRFVKRKGIFFVLEAIKDLDFVEYIIVGKGPQKDKLISFVKRNNLEYKVKIIVSPNDEQLAQLYSTCDIFILTPYEPNSGDFEGFGIVYLEAGLFRKPCIASKSGGIKEAVIHKKTGILVDSKDIKGIKKAILILSQNKNLRKFLGDNAYKRIIEKFNPKIQTSKLYSEIIKLF